MPEQIEIASMRGHVVDLTSGKAHATQGFEGKRVWRFSRVSPCDRPRRKVPQPAQRAGRRWPGIKPWSREREPSEATWKALSELLSFQWASGGGPVSLQEAGLRLVLAIVLRAGIGIDRELKHKPPGLRTNMLVALGAARSTEAGTIPPVVCADADTCLLASHWRWR